MNFPDFNWLGDVFLKVSSRSFWGGVYILSVTPSITASITCSNLPKPKGMPLAKATSSATRAAAWEVAGQNPTKTAKVYTKNLKKTTSSGVGWWQCHLPLDFVHLGVGGWKCSMVYSRLMFPWQTKFGNVCKSVIFVRCTSGPSSRAACNSFFTKAGRVDIWSMGRLNIYLY